MQFKIKPLLVALAALVVVGALAFAATGCGNDNTSSSSSTTSDSGNAADLAFVTDMIPHHQGAVQMAEIAQTKAEHPQVRALAKAIIAAQNSEIATMRRVQKTLNGEDLHAGHMGMSQSDMGMDGDMPGLESAASFDKAFIDMMIPHHQGAIRMAEQQLKNGKLPELQTMAKNIIQAQNAEIAQTRQWRKQWYANSRDAGSAGSPMQSGASMMNGG